MSGQAPGLPNGCGLAALWPVGLWLAAFGFFLWWLS